MMPLFLEPLDVWLFRDGRPFDAQSDHRAASVFPPYPSVMQGVIRSHQLVVQGVDLRDDHAIKAAVGDAEDYGRLRLRGPWIACRRTETIVTRYFPLPADLVASDGGLVALRPTRVSAGQISSAVTDWLLMSPVPPQKTMPGEWLAEAELVKYLRGEPPAASPSRALFVRESRLGIGRDDERRVTREAMLYEVEFIRTQPGGGLYVEVEGYAGWHKAGTLRIGGEGRAAGYDILDEKPPWPLLPYPAPLPPRFKVYFATPTYFERGWLPRDWQAFFTAPVELATAALPRYESVGGYDWAANRHKPARRTVPAGSVYYFVNPGGAALRPDMVQNALTDAGAEIGFGQILITEWKE
jgi:CRISPR-associated protein Cmr3